MMAGLVNLGAHQARRYLYVSGYCRVVSSFLLSSDFMVILFVFAAGENESLTHVPVPLSLVASKFLLCCAV